MKACTLLSSGHGTGVDGHVALPQVAVGWPQCTGSALRGSGAEIWLEELLRLPPPLLLPPLLLLWFLLLFLFQLPPLPLLPPPVERDSMEDGGLAARDAMLV
jgi:hypothetical protein